MAGVAAEKAATMGRRSGYVALGLMALAIAGIAIALQISSPSKVVLALFGMAAALYAIGKVGGVRLLISLLADHPDIRREAAGALWSLSDDEKQKELIAQRGGIRSLVDMLKQISSADNSESDVSKRLGMVTAAGSLRSLAARAENRPLIVEAGGIAQLVTLLFAAAIVPWLSHNSRLGYSFRSGSSS